MPATVSVAAVLLARAQVPPLLARVIVTTPLLEVAVAEQWEKPVGSVMVGVAGTVKLLLKVTVMVFPAASCPVDEVVNPTVHVEVALGVVEPGAKVTLLTEVAVMVTADAGLTAVASCEVASLKVLAA